MRFEHGDSVAPLKVNGPAPAGKKGMRVTFCASTDTFKNVTEFDLEKLEHRYRELAFLNSGVRIKLVEARHAEPETHDLYYHGRTGAFIRYHERNKTDQPTHPTPTTT